MANFVVDFETDRGYQVLNQIAAKHSLPAYVLIESTAKLASEDSRHSCAILSPEPRFPTNTKAACWLSHAYYLQQIDKLSSEDKQKAEKFLRRKAAFWDITEDVERLVAREAEVIKTASHCDERFPLRNPEEVKAAANWLLTAYRTKQAKQLPVADRIELAGRLLDHGAALHCSAADVETLYKAACLRGCYSGKRVAEKLASCVLLQPHMPASKLASVFSSMYGNAMQSQHKTAAMLCDKYRVFGDEPAELALAVDTAEDVYVFPSGSVVTKKAIDAFQHPEIGIYYGETLTLNKTAFSTAIADMQAENANKFEKLMHDAGVNFVVRRPIENHALDFSLLR
jgi:hypothetical protein